MRQKPKPACPASTETLLGLSWLLRLFYRTHVGDAHCGLRALTRECYDRLDLQSDGKIVLVGTDGSTPRRLTTHEAGDSSPRWSPDGLTLAWVGQRTRQEADIYYVRLRREDDEETKRNRKLE